MSLNGNVQKHLLHSVWSGLASRLVTILLIPLIGFVAYQANGSIEKNTNAVVELRVTLEKVNANQDAIAKQLSRHEDLPAHSRANRELGTLRGRVDGLERMILSAP